MPMTKTFTENDLLKFLYGELNYQQKIELQRELLTDQNLQDELNELKEAVSLLDEANYKPSNRAIQNILDFSKGQAVQSA